MNIPTIIILFLTCIPIGYILIDILKELCQTVLLRILKKPNFSYSNYYYVAYCRQLIPYEHYVHSPKLIRAERVYFRLVNIELLYHINRNQ